MCSLRAVFGGVRRPLLSAARVFRSLHICLCELERLWFSFFVCAVRCLLCLLFTLCSRQEKVSFELFERVLRSSPVCAWGECLGRRNLNDKL